MLVTLFTTLQNNDSITKLSPKDLYAYYELVDLDLAKVFQSIAVTSLTGAQRAPPPAGGPHL